MEKQRNEGKTHEYRHNKKQGETKPAETKAKENPLVRRRFPPRSSSRSLNSIRSPSRPKPTDSDAPFPQRGSQKRATRPGKQKMLRCILITKTISSCLALLLPRSTLFSILPPSSASTKLRSKERRSKMAGNKRTRTQIIKNTPEHRRITPPPLPPQPPRPLPLGPAQHPPLPP
jgi:hypothetical protein